MIVVDASLVLDVAISANGGAALGNRLDEHGVALLAPEILDLEVLQALRRHVRLGVVDAMRARAGLTTLGELNIERFSHRTLTDRIWSLRDNLTAYGAAYVALAEALDVPLWTRDAKLAGVPGVSARVEVL